MSDLTSAESPGFNMFKYISGTLIFSNIDVVSSKVNIKDSVPKTPCAISLFPKIPLKGAIIFLSEVSKITSPSSTTLPIIIFSFNISLFLIL